MECLKMTKSGTPFRSPATTPMLPPETWNQIFQYLNPEDLHSVIKTCPEWDELLEDKKNALLLPMVIPSVMKYFDRKTILKLREVTTSIKQAFDKTFQTFYNSDDSSSSQRYYEDSSSQRHLRSVAHRISLSYSFSFQDFEGFLSKVYPNFSQLSSDINPFLLRHISYTFEAQTDVLLGNFQHVIEILPKFGHHLTSLDCNIIALNSNQLFQEIVSQLCFVPNLKRLGIRPGLHESFTLTNPFKTVHKFPSLPNLVFLDVRNVSTTAMPQPTFVLASVRNYSQQLTSFTCDATLLALQELNVNVLNSMFQNIKKFHLVGKDVNFVRGLQKLAKVSWSLKKLNLQVYRKGKMSAQKVMSAINNFNKSLIYLEVNCILIPDKMEINKGNNSEERYRKMSNLKFFITNSKNMELTFLKEFLQISCQNLEQIHFQTNNIMSREEGRWVLRKIENLEKVVFWNDANTLPKIYTMRKTKMDCL